MSSPEPSLPAPTASPATTGSSSNPFAGRLAELRSMYDSDKLLSASRLLYSLDAELKSTSCSTPHLQSLQTELSTPFFTRVRHECTEVHRLRTLLHDRTGWTLSYSGAETRVWYRREEGMPSHSILTEGTIHAPLLNVAALMYEADLYEQLFWYVTRAYELPLPAPKRLRRAAHISMYAPWPLYNRDVAVYAYAVDALDEEEACVMVVSRSLKEGDEVDEPPAPNKVVRVDMHDSGFELVPVSPGVVKARFLYNVDPHLAFVPMALINWGARMLCRWSLRTLESRARDLSKMPKQYQERLATAEVYEYIRGRLGEYWAAKGLSPETVQAEEHRVSRQSAQSGNFDPDATPSGPPASVMKSVLRGEQGTETSRARKSLSRLFLGSVTQ